LQQLEGDIRLNHQMKKVFSILFASMILLSGMHLTIASHICCGELAAVKYSFTGEKASCGMTDIQSPIPINGEIKTDCCKNKVASFTTDHNYFPTFYKVQAFDGESTPLLAVFPDVFIAAPALSKTYYSMVGPPVLQSCTAVYQSFICVFII
jgi:hypothetical protein